MSLLRRLQPRGAEDEEEAAAAQLAGLQVLLHGSRQFGPNTLRELTVRAALPRSSRAARGPKKADTSTGSMHCCT